MSFHRSDFCFSPQFPDERVVFGILWALAWLFVRRMSQFLLSISFKWWVLSWRGEVSVVDVVSCNMEAFIRACQLKANVMCRKTHVLILHTF
jgi:hypothetical protein